MYTGRGSHRVTMIQRYFHIVAVAQEVVKHYAVVFAFYPVGHNQTLVGTIWFEFAEERGLHYGITREVVDVERAHLLQTNIGGHSIVRPFHIFE